MLSALRRGAKIPVGDGAQPVDNPSLRAFSGKVDSGFPSENATT